MNTGTDSPLPNEVPEKIPSHYMDYYHLTQLGLANPDPSHPLEQCNPTTFDGKEAIGPLGYVSFCKEVESLPSLEDFYKQQENKRTPSQLTRSAELESSSSRKSATSHLLNEERREGGKRSSMRREKSAASPPIERKESLPAENMGRRKESRRKTKKKSESERVARKEEKRRRAALPPIYVEKLEDFPEEAQKLIVKAKIPTEKILANLSVLAHIIRFRTGWNVRTKDYVKSSDRDEDSGVEKKSNSKNSGVESGTEPTENSEQHTVDAVKSKETKEKDDDADSDMLEPGIVPKGGAEQFADGDVKKIYKNLQHAGRGGFGSVFVAKSTLDKCDVAIKKIPHVTKKAKRTNYNEIGFLTYCKHPNVVKFYRSHLVDDEAWLVMEYMHGGTLSEAVDRYQFGEGSIAYVAREVLNALEYLHSSNLVHRDLKSANIMLTVEGKIKLIDFGLCVDHTQRKLCHMAGSPFWMPPEMILGLNHGPPADIWSFAICLLELANGKPPNRKSPIRAMFLAATEGVTIPHPDKHSDEFKDFISLCLQIDQTKRATPTELKKHPFLAKADTQDTMRKILAQIFISNAISSLDYGL